MFTMRNLLLLLTLAFSPTLPAWSADLTADEIVANANRAAYYSGKDGRADVTMTITASGGLVRERAFTMLRLTTDGNNQKFYVYFHEPADVRKMAYLVWKNVGGDDDRWLWLPALNLKKRIAPGDKRTSFVGSDFFYEDVSGRSLNDDQHTLLETTDTDYHLKHVPKDSGSVEFAWFETRIDRTTFLPIKATYFDAAGNPYREVEALKIETIQGYPTVTVAEARDLKSGSRTRNNFSHIAYDTGLSEQIFTERFLRRPPREVTR